MVHEVLVSALFPWHPERDSFQQDSNERDNYVVIRSNVKDDEARQLRRRQQQKVQLLEAGNKFATTRVSKSSFCPK